MVGYDAFFQNLETKCVFFYSDSNGGQIFVERTDKEKCNTLSGQSGNLELFECKYTCQIGEINPDVENPYVSHFNTDQMSEQLQLNETSDEEPEYPNDEPEQLVEGRFSILCFKLE